MGTGSTIGMVGGGAAGFALGGPIGAIGGAYAGNAVGGMFDGGGGGDNNRWDPQGYQYQAPQIDNSSNGAVEDHQNVRDQNALDAQMKMRAMGTGGPSVAQQQLQQGLAQSQMATLQAAANTRGGTAGQVAASDNAQNVNATMAGQTNQQAAALRAQEQIAAQGQYAQQLGLQRGENFQIDNANLGAQGQAQQTNAGMINATRGANATAYQADQQKSGQMFGGAMGAIGGIGAAGLL